MPVKEKTKAATTPRTTLSKFRLDDSAVLFVPEAVQSNVIRSVNPQQARYVFFQIVDGDAFRRFRGRLQGHWRSLVGAACARRRPATAVAPATGVAS